MNRIQALILTVFFILFSTNIYAQTCVTQPSCSELGYVQTEDDCIGKNVVRCPFDSTAIFCGGSACPETVTCTETDCKTYCGGNCVECEPCPATKTCDRCEKTCGGNCVECSTCTYQLQYLYYCDVADSCSYNGTTYRACKVCRDSYVVDSRGDCVCPSTVTATYGCDKCCRGKCTVASVCDSSNSSWCAVHNTCHSYCCAAQTCSSRPDIFDGRGNTAKIIAQIGDEALAATACNQFYPVEENVAENDVHFGAGKWYLPAMGELVKMYGLNGLCISSLYTGSGGDKSKGMDKIEASLSMVGGESFRNTTGGYWSSSEATEANVHYLSPKGGTRSAYKKASQERLRCFNLLENCFSSSLPYSQWPQIGDIMYSDKTWSSSVIANKIPVGIITDVHGTDVTIANLKNLKFSDDKTVGGFNAATPYSGAKQVVYWATADYASTNITAVTDYEDWEAMNDALQAYSYW